jgi:hypothetical protein
MCGKPAPTLGDKGWKRIWYTSYIPFPSEPFLDLPQQPGVVWSKTKEKGISS